MVSIARTEGMYLLNQFSSSKRRSHALSKIARKYTIFDNETILSGLYFASQQCHSLIKSVENIFRHYFVKLFNNTNNIKSILQNHIVFFLFLFCNIKEIFFTALR